MLIDLPEDIYYDLSNALQSMDKLKQVNAELMTTRVLLGAVIDAIRSKSELSFENNSITINSVPITKVIHKKLQERSL